MTRRMIEQQLDALAHRLPHRWWTPYAVLAGALTVGFLLSRMPALRLVDMSARTVKTGIGVAGALAAVDRFVADRRHPGRMKAA